MSDLQNTMTVTESGSPATATADTDGHVVTIAEPRRTWVSRFQNQIIGLVAVVVALVAWQLVAASGAVRKIILPSPVDVGHAMVRMFQSPTILTDLWVSGSELLIGFGLAIAAGLVLGVLMGWYRRVNAACDPFITFLYNTPRVALLPLLIIWFGIGIWSKVAVVFLGAFFPIVMSTADGIRGLDATWIKAARSFGASDWKLFRTVALPGAVPFILTGLRLGIGHALVGVVVGELVAAQHGVGLILARAGQTFQTPMVFAAIVVIAVAGMLLNSLLRLLEKHFQKWKPDPTR